MSRSLKEYEKISTDFYKETGVMEPGKGNKVSVSEWQIRQLFWLYWLKTKAKIRALQCEIEDLRQESQT